MADDRSIVLAPEEALVKLENEFTVPVDIDAVYNALNDPQKVTPCFPGATLDSHDGDDFTGTVKVKLGPISMTYKGKGTFVERDATAHKVVVDAQGRDSRGNGTASAKATLQMTEDGGGTKVTVLTEMQVTGKPAQFGRGVMSDVGDKILGQFAQCLADTLGSAGPSATTAAPAPSANGAAPAASDGGGTAGEPSAPTRVAAGSGPPEPVAMPTTVAGAAKATEGARPGGSAAPIAASTGAAASPATSTAGNGVRDAAEPARRAPVEAIDLLETSRDAVLKRLVPVGGAAGVLALLIAIVVILRGRSSR